MGKINERFRLSISQLGDWRSAIRSTERVYNERPYPELFSAAKTVDETLTTTYNGILTVDFTTYYTNAPITIDVVCDFFHSTTGGGLAIGEIKIDGVLDNNKVRLDDGAVRATVTQIWTTTIEEPGEHAIELGVRKTAAGGVAMAQAPDTKMRVTVYW